MIQNVNIWARIAALLAFIILLTACEQSSDAQSDSQSDGQSTDLFADAEFVLDPDPDQALLSSLANGLNRVVQRLNDAYFEGLLSESTLQCISDAGVYPLVDYYCGDNNNAGLLSEYGFPVLSYSLESDTECVDAITEGQSTAVVCRVKAADFSFDDEWKANIRTNVGDKQSNKSVVLFRGNLPFFVDYEFDPSVCVMTIDSASLITRSNKEFCDFAVLELQSKVSAYE